MALKFPKLDSHSRRILIYVYGRHCGHTTENSKICYLIVLAGDTNICSILRYSSRKASRAVRTTTAVDGLTLADRFDNAHSLRASLERMTSSAIPIMIMIDWEILLNIINWHRKASYKRVLIGLQASLAAHKEL